MSLRTISFSKGSCNNTSFFLPSRLPDKHCNDFFRASARHVSSNRASDYQEMGLRGSNCCCLGSPCYHISHLDGSSLITGYYLFFYGFHCCLCLFVICVSYISILIKFRCGAHPRRYFATSAKQRKLTVTLFITTLVSLLLWLPYHILVIVNLKTSDLPNSFPRLEAVRLGYSLFVLFYANSLVNPVLYTLRIPDFKRAFFSLFRRQYIDNSIICRKKNKIGLA